MKNRRTSVPESEKRPARALGDEIGRAIRLTRRRRGLTQGELAQRCGVSRRHIAGIERGSNFTVAILLAIAAELVDTAIPIAEFLMRRESPERGHDRTRSRSL